MGKPGGALATFALDFKENQKACCICLESTHELLSQLSICIISAVYRDQT